MEQQLALLILGDLDPYPPNLTRRASPPPDVRRAINAGGDIAVACTRTDTPDWVIAIEDPRDRSRMLRSLHLRTGAVATSGTAARGAHIVDPATGRPVESLLSATVIGPELTWADVYATAAFVKGPSAVGWLATLDQHAALLVEPDGRLVTVGAPEH